MQALLFEMKPRDGHEEHYFSHAATLRPILLQNDGLLFIQRYRSLSRPGVILSHSLWRDEASITQWRNNSEHRKSQIAGRQKHFEDYRIRISHALYGHAETEVLDTSCSETTDRFLTIVRSDSTPANNGIDTYENIAEAGSFLYVVEHVKRDAGLQECLDAQQQDKTRSAILARVSRDYGMYSREQAPDQLATLDDTHLTTAI